MRRKFFYVLIFVWIYQACNLLNLETVRYNYLKKIPALSKKNDSLPFTSRSVENDHLKNKHDTSQTKNPRNVSYDFAVEKNYLTQHKSLKILQNPPFLVNFENYTTKFFPIHHNAFLKRAPQGKNTDVLRPFDVLDIILLIFIILSIVMLIVLLFIKLPQTEAGYDCCLIFFVLILIALLILVLISIYD